MRREEVSGQRGLAVCFLRAAAMYGLFWLIFTAACLCLRFSCRDMGVEERNFHVGCAVILAVSLNTVLGKFAQFDRREKARFHVRQDGRLNFSVRTELGVVMRSRSFWAEVVTFWVFAAVFSLSWGLDCLPGAILGDISDGLAVRALILAVMVSAVFGLALFSHIEARKVWLEEGKEKGGEIPYAVRLFKWLVMSLVLYCFGFFLLPYLMPTVVSVFDILRVLEAWRILPAAVMIVLCCVALTYLRALLHRRRFIKRLKRLCRERGFVLSDIRRPYRSILRENDGASFTVTANGKTYIGKLIASVKRSNPIVLTPKGICSHIFSFRIRYVELFRIVENTDYRFAGQGRKVLVVTPVPNKLFSCHDRLYREMDNGDRIGDYTLFSGGGFLGALARDCIERCGQ